jgi:Arc/MetJ-type ribon-helix-helix transcriptional regulator
LVKEMTMSETSANGPDETSAENSRCGSINWADIEEKLQEQGIDLENLCSPTGDCDQVKMVCVASDMGASFREMGQKPRGETVMVRIDATTRSTLDAWVETGYFKSRSEAAALFISEGLKIRDSELERLKGPLDDLKKAKESLRDRAKEIFGEE